MFTGSKGGRCVRLTTLLPSCAESIEIWEPQPFGTLRACPGCNGIDLLLEVSWGKSRKLTPDSSYLRPET